MKGTEYMRLSHFDTNGSVLATVNMKMRLKFCVLLQFIYILRLSRFKPRLLHGIFTKRGLELNKEKGE